MKTRTMNFILLSLFFTMTTLQSCDKDHEKQAGEIVFWKFTDMLNCGSIEVKVLINSKEIGTINEDFRPYDSIPACGSPNCLTVNYPIGSYSYKAECYCGTSKTIIGYWAGTLEVKQDSCIKVFFDIEGMTKQ